jgi:hypothetical protein
MACSWAGSVAFAVLFSALAAGTRGHHAHPLAVSGLREVGKIERADVMAGRAGILAAGRAPRRRTVWSLSRLPQNPAGLCGQRMHSWVVCGSLCRLRR